MESKSDGNATRPDEKMPDAMMESIIRTRHVTDALASLRQLHPAMFDMTIHQPQLHEEVLTLDEQALPQRFHAGVMPTSTLG